MYSQINMVEAGNNIPEVIGINRQAQAYQLGEAVRVVTLKALNAADKISGYLNRHPTQKSLLVGVAGGGVAAVLARKRIEEITEEKLLKSLTGTSL